MANAQLEAGSNLRDVIAVAVSLTILIVAGFGIYNIMLMTINEKIREIAILKAMGFCRLRHPPHLPHHELRHRARRRLRRHGPGLYSFPASSTTFPSTWPASPPCPWPMTREIIS